MRTLCLVRTGRKETHGTTDKSGTNSPAVRVRTVNSNHPQLNCDYSNQSLLNLRCTDPNIPWHVRFACSVPAKRNGQKEITKANPLSDCGLAS